MQSLTYQQSNGFISAALINRAQPKPGVSCGALRDAVRAWSAVAGQDVVTALIVEEWHRIGGEGIDFPADHSRARQKLFRFLDNHFNSEPEDNVMARLARLEKETSEAKIAVAMDAPRHQKLKELSEGIVEMYRVDPGLTGPLMEMVQIMLGAI